MTEGTKILIVDDNKTNQYIFRKYLEFFGCIPVAANNGKEALSVLYKSKNENPIDMVLTDFQMPLMDGFDLAKP